MAEEYLLVAAIDFGTTYSGYAFQFRHEYNPKDPTVITAPQCWNDGKKQIVTMKTPTSILLKEDKSIDSFGFEAERKYADICLDEEQDEWYFFRRFKMKLQEGEGLRKTSELFDETGKKSLPAIDVFGQAIDCIKSKLLIELDKKQNTLSTDDVLYVITVPAIWDEKSKQFMKEAAVKVENIVWNEEIALTRAISSFYMMLSQKCGISDRHVKIALEPEAASLYCQYLPVKRFVTGGGQAKCSLSEPGTVYMILDLGGGTADITVHEKLENGELKEVHSACGGPWGGTMVDSYFIQALSNVMKPLALSEFMYQNSGDYIDLMSDFEHAKRNVDQTTDKPINVKLPICLNELTKKHINMTLTEAIEESNHAGQLKVIGDKLRISPDLARSFFTKVTRNITMEMDTCIDEVAKQGKAVSLILMVGGFSESPFVQDIVKERYIPLDIKVVVPEEAGLSVLKGAVIFGRQPGVISSRVLRYTYGAEIMPKFDPKQHDQSKKTGDGNRVKNVFMPFANKGCEMKLGDQIIKTYTTVKPNQDSIILKIFCADRQCKYTTEDGCKFVGTLNLHLQQPTTELQDLKVVYEFGGTEIVVNGKEVKSGNICKTSLKMVD